MGDTRKKDLCIRDPLYGFIEFTDLEAKIIQTDAFQRLRHIKQLGTTSWVFPSGNHTRFEHSLGVLHLSKRILKTIGEDNFSEDDILVFTLASLLHDIGHSPFSHVGEKILFPDGDDHEKVGKRIIEYTGIGDLISDENGKESLNRIHFIMKAVETGGSPDNQILRDLLTGQVGTDRMDFLQRDSYYLGVEYGRFDLERVFETLVYKKEIERKDVKEGSTFLSWEEGGTQALEHYVLSRYFMYTQIYYHKTTRILEYHLIQAIRDFLSSNYNSPTYPTDSSEIETYLSITSLEIFDWILKSKDYKPIFYERKFFKYIPGFGKIHQKDEEIQIWDDLEKFLNKNNEYQNRFFIDKPYANTYDQSSTEGKFIRIEKEEGVKPLHEVSPIIDSLIPIRTRRLYCADEIKENIKQVAKEFINQHEKYKNDEK